MMSLKHKKIISIVVIVGIAGTCLVGASALSQTRLHGESNIITEEMAVLYPAFKMIIDAIALGDIKIARSALTDMHEAREKVEMAVKAGQRVALPKNQDKFKEFVKLDDKFGKDLETLSEAAETGNNEMVKDQICKFLNDCVFCHEKFRK
jgi:cytochrome c556